jgi:hypothetical protein
MRTGRVRRSAKVVDLESLRADAIRWRRFEAMVEDSERYRYGADRPATEYARVMFARVGRAVIEAQAAVEKTASGVPAGALWHQALPRFHLAKRHEE